MHRTGHWLGLDVHDAGEYKRDGEWRELVPGMVLTVEPGCYIRPGAGVPEHFAGIGVRIEDDALVTESGLRDPHRGGAEDRRRHRSADASRVSDRAERPRRVVIGGGPGRRGARAGARRERGLRVQLLEAREAACARPTTRPLALSYGSRLILERLGVWDELEPRHADRAHPRFAARRFRTHRADGARSGTAGARLCRRLRSAARRVSTPHSSDSSVSIVRGARVTVDRARRGDARASSSNDDGAVDECDCFGGRARGRHGAPRAMSAFAPSTMGRARSPRGVETARAHANIAYERFTPEGPLALLPFGTGYALVWTLAPEPRRRCVRHPPDAFLCALQETFGERVGPLHRGSRACASAHAARRGASTVGRAALDRQRGADAASGRRPGIQPRVARRMGARARDCAGAARMRRTLLAAYARAAASTAPAESRSPTALVENFLQRQLAARARARRRAHVSRLLPAREGFPRAPHDLRRARLNRRETSMRTQSRMRFSTRSSDRLAFMRRVLSCTASTRRRERTYRAPRRCGRISLFFARRAITMTPFPKIPLGTRCRSVLSAEEQSDRRAHGGRDRSAVPSAVQDNGRRHGGVRDGREQFAPVGLGENTPPREPRRRSRSDLGADRGRRSADARGRRAATTSTKARRSSTSTWAAPRRRSAT